MKHLESVLAKVRTLLSARVLLTFGLVSILTSAMLGAQFIGLMPDRKSATLDGRANLAEAVAASTLGHLSKDSVGEVKALLDFIVERNNGVVSAAIRKSDRSIAIQAGPHTQLWESSLGDSSTDLQIVVPLMSSGSRWGQLELRYDNTHGQPWHAAWFGEWISDSAKMTLFIALMCFGSFYFYLGRMLKQLDPSKAVPERVRSALDTLTEGLLLIDPNAQIVLANQSLADMLGLAPEKLISKKVASLGWTDAKGGAIDPSNFPWITALATGETALKVPISLKDATGTRRSFLANCAAIPGPGGKAGGVLMSLDDVTEMEIIQGELRASQKAADEANQAKSDFLANMSHEIRTPMNAVLGFTEVLRRSDKKMDPTSRKHLDTIHKNGSHLLELINDILDLSKVEAGHFEVERIDCETHQVISDVVEVLGVKAREKGVALTWSVQDKVPRLIQSDPSRLRQMITNLVGNAIKFTSQGAVTVTQRVAYTESQGRKKTWLCIDIKDSGIGIDPAKAEAIFEPFVQAESSTTRRFGGTGLGLSISRKFARALGGDIKVQSQIGQGSTFTIVIDPGTLESVEWIDNARAQQVQHASATQNNLAWRFTGQRILVVDDSPENRELVKLVMQDVGLHVSEAENGKIGMEMVLSQPFDLVLMDMHMPVMDGTTATRALRKQGVTLPIIAFTAHALAGFEREINEAGCSGYLTKPINIDQMLQMLGERLGGTQVALTVEPAPTAVEAASVKESAPLTESKPMGETQSSDPIHSRLEKLPKLHSVIDAFVKRLPQQIGLMHQALARKDCNELAGLAHWLKGSGGSVGFDCFTEPARNLEYAAKAGELAHLAPMVHQIDALSQRLASPLKPKEAALA